MYLQAAYNKMGEVEAVFGPFHQNGNHWTLVYVNFVTSKLVYVDPLGPPTENATAEKFAYNWLEWALLHNDVCPDASVPAHLEAVTVPHALQSDGRNCGIFTMCVRTYVLYQDNIRIKLLYFCSHKCSFNYFSLQRD